MHSMVDHGYGVTDKISPAVVLHRSTWGIGRRSAFRKRNELSQKSHLIIISPQHTIMSTRTSLETASVTAAMWWDGCVISACKRLRITGRSGQTAPRTITHQHATMYGPISDRPRLRLVFLRVGVVQG